ncbi:hypothetical protein Q361_11818 [Flavobacterium croceum DSM 17960]|uniref:Uncharacterized protein n=1 Tax=Flavobacterium croceum DSM 17960 TaxID=1121886 RepID=A0A2S4N5A9_9FLAO|nr:hypothetical protein Q361_11818 [Flavobacterium croceum DSM 17960]
MAVPFTLFIKNIRQYLVAYFTFCVIAIANALFDLLSSNKPEQNHLVKPFCFDKFTMSTRLQGNIILQAVPYNRYYQKPNFGFGYTKKHVFYYLI